MCLLSMALSSAAQTDETENVVASLLGHMLCAILSDHSISRQDMKDIEYFALAQHFSIGVGGKRDDTSMRSFS